MNWNLFLGQTPVDIAKAWADPRVLDIIQKKWDSLPTQKDGKKKGAKKGGGKAKRPLSVPPENKDVGAKVRCQRLQTNWDITYYCSFRMKRLFWLDDVSYVTTLLEQRYSVDAVDKYPYCW